MAPNLNRRQFLSCTSTAAAAVSIVPRHVLGAPGQPAPNSKIALAYIGCGTQGLREILPLLATPELQIVAVCDPNRDSSDYVDWSANGLRDEIRRFLERPNWREGRKGIPGGREVAKEVAEIHYAKVRAKDQFRGITAYADFRELLEQEKSVDAVKVMTPDHLHAAVCIAAMKKGKHTMVHKPLANRVLEARLVIETARQTKVATHFSPASAGTEVRQIAGWIKDGVIGTLREIHNWSNRPVWPQYPTLPTDRPPVPAGFDWDLWLGPSLPRPFHPHYTHAVFRGWYEFGGGAIADMGHYSLWPVFQQFQLDAPVVVESTPSHLCTLNDLVSVKIQNDHSFPAACTVRFKFAAKAGRPALDLYWYDGGMKPPTPDELEEDNRELAAEGMMFVGDKGRILAGFRGENAKLIPERKHAEFLKAKGAAPGAPAESRGARSGAWINAIKGGPPTYGDFLLAGPISEAFNLAAISLRLGGKRLKWDAAKGQITNLPAANKWLTREYRKGWELA